MSAAMTELGTSALVPLPMLLALAGAGAALMLSGRPAMQRTLSVVVLSSIVVVAAVLLVVVDRSGTQVLHVGGWPAGIGISLVADRLAALMLLVSAAVTLAVLVYSLGQGITEQDREAPVSIYHPTFLVLVAGVSNAFLSGDLFNLFVSFEMLLFASYVLLTLGGTSSRVRAGTIYVVINLTSSMIFLISLAATYAAVGTLNLAQIAERARDLDPDVALLLQLLLLVTFSIKAAVFPLGLWLPDSYPTAPAPVTAVFAGLLTKVGVYAILRVQTLLFPDSPLQGLLLWAALATMIIGILGAIAQSDIKRMLSFTLVSHIGYMLMGIGFASAAGISGAVFYVAHHITIQTALFLVVGLIEARAGSTALLRIGGIARLSPVIGVLFFIPAMNLAGIPPMSGFIGKVGLIQAGIADDSWLALLLVAGSVVCSLLTLYAVARTWGLAFWRTPAEAHEMMLSMSDLEDSARGVLASNASGRDRRSPDRHHPESGIIYHHGHVHMGPVTVRSRDLAMARALRDDGDTTRDLYQRIGDGDLPKRLPLSIMAPAAALVAASLGLTFIAGPLFAYTERTAAELGNSTAYIKAVLEPSSDRGGL